MLEFQLLKHAVGTATFLFPTEVSLCLPFCSLREHAQKCKVWVECNLG